MTLSVVYAFSFVDLYDAYHVPAVVYLVEHPVVSDPRPEEVGGSPDLYRVLADGFLRELFDFCRQSFCKNPFSLLQEAGGLVGLVYVEHHRPSCFLRSL